jgi:ribosomal protein S14
MKYIVKKDKLARKNHVFREYNVMYLKSLYYNCQLSDLIRKAARLQISVLSKKLGYRVRIKNRCYQTGRSGSVDSYTHLSRSRFREFANMGHLPGIKKSSW